MSDARVHVRDRCQSGVVWHVEVLLLNSQLAAMTWH